MKKYIFKETGKYIKCADASKAAKISNSIKMHLRANKIDIYDYLENIKNFNLIKCNFCNNYNSSFFLVAEIIDGIIDVVDVDYTRQGKQKQQHYCFNNDNCPGKKLNRNSVQYVSTVFNLSKEEALTLIHKRNKTPFYRTSHKTDADYKKSQSRDREWYAANGYDYNKKIAERLYNGSLERYKNEFGDDLGYRIWQEKQNNKAITLANLQKKYGNHSGKIRYNNWLASISPSLELCMQRYGTVTGRLKYIENTSKSSKFATVTDITSLVDFCVAHITTDSTYILIDYPIEIKLSNLKIVNPSLLAYNITLDSLINLIKIQLPLLKTLDNTMYYRAMKREGFGIITYTDKGEMLRSKFELSFYIKMKQAKLDKVEYSVDKNYPGSSSRYDFYFPKANVYIEIAPMLNKKNKDDIYVKNINAKIKNFSPLIVQNDNEEDIAINKLKEFYYG